MCIDSFSCLTPTSRLAHTVAGINSRLASNAVANSLFDRISTCRITHPSWAHYLTPGCAEYYPFIPSEISLVVSGHAHGGQWRFYDPFKRIWRGVLAPGQGWFPKWTKGVYDERLVVSAGLSNTTWIPRINTPTEIVYIEP